MFSNSRSRILLLGLSLWLSATAIATAQVPAAAPVQSEALPAWIVPVLRLVSATHVEPTTGVVLSADGLVMVPVDFAEMGDEIIVLDGGTDIIRNGRPARTEQRFNHFGVAVLRVKGLQRDGASLPGVPLADGSELLLQAFPPAEQIAEGQPPVSQAATVTVFRENNRPSISAETLLPNVTGALVDTCRDLAGYSVADGVQALEISPATRYAWPADLQSIYEALGIEPSPSRCPDETAQAEASPEPVVEPESEAVEPDPQPEPEPEAPVEPDVEADESEAAQPEEEAGPDEPVPELLPPFEDDSAGAADDGSVPETQGPGWWWLLLAAALVIAGLLLHRWRRSGPVEVPVESDDEAGEFDVEPETDDEIETDTEASLDSQLTLSASFADGSNIEIHSAVSSQAINLVIGRGGGADLVVDNPAISRHHAALNGRAGELTFADLGSSNGSSINGVPCLEGEIMYIEPGDDLVLGNVRCHIEIRPGTNLDGGKD